MNRYNIFNQDTAVDHGTFEAPDSDAALDLMAQRAGYRDRAHMRAALGEEPNFIVSQISS